ncbi:hypothetical protein ABIB80_007535, partial [Bradyrhizobium sp. i1.15.2]
NTGQVSGTSATLEQAESRFHQDLNGDGVIGILTTSIEAFGSTSLVQVGSNFYMNPVAGGSGPALKYAGSPVVAGQSGGWTPIAVEQTSSGYEVAWRYPGSDQFTIWTTDSSGNFATNTGQVSGTSATLLLAEARFHQDLNADGTIGPVASHAIDWHLHV